MRVTSSPTPYRNVTMFPGGSSYSADPPKRVTGRRAIPRYASLPRWRRHSARDARHRGLLRRRPKLFPDLHKGAVDGCLGRNAQFVDDEEKLPLCQYRFEQKKFSDPCGFRRHRSDLSFQAGGLVALFRLACLIKISIRRIFGLAPSLPLGCSHQLQRIDL